ncbi:hypothetical protein QYY83_06990 [Xanthomonas campestris pv. campestris]|uniref:hypothetical protein n=1 Tax=Xanthomonas TaxID=338 RepID=UPI000CEEA3AD|nr:MULTISPECIES: hypothetical protein [Xanthomonas]MEA0624160.1 hypothetical protein [Xanthomonas campestris pv. campestris]MEA0664893.1 hypothetical protein [Xanthomonas campestris pv. campestris]MEA0673700.1 hypothetical protein [Xanthomonas campestris pv. campestris]MEA0704973.1 hypothetical protein [Xanthomonas campestris pv. campestris]MEA0723391.1 hypothetical protein [Xanthomonas campestris pv. campestris]
MSKARFAVIGTLIVSLVACSGGGPSQDDRQSAFLLYVQDNSNDKAKIEDFESGKCVKAEGAPSYTCDVSAKVEALGQDFGSQMDGVYTFTEIGGEWKITGRVQ